MKRCMLFCAIALCLFGTTYLIADSVPEVQPCECTGGGGGTTFHYKREVKNCSVKDRTEVTCTYAGLELCVPQNCP